MLKNNKFMIRSGLLKMKKKNQILENESAKITSNKNYQF